jgi:hypothetical protein
MNDIFNQNLMLKFTRNVWSLKLFLQQLLRKKISTSYFYNLDSVQWIAKTKILEGFIRLSTLIDSPRLEDMMLGKISFRTSLVISFLFRLSFNIKIKHIFTTPVQCRLLDRKICSDSTC